MNDFNDVVKIEAKNNLTHKRRRKIQKRKKRCNTCNYDKCLQDKDNNCCCNKEHSVHFDKCQLFKGAIINSNLDCQGRMLEVYVRLNNVCLNKDLALGVYISKNNSVLTFKVIRIKAKIDLCNCKKYPPTNICGSVEKKFCFVFPADICKNLEEDYDISVVAHYLFEENECKIKYSDIEKYNCNYQCQCQYF